MINPELLKILVCPETREPVAEADATLIHTLNQKITAGQLRNRAGQPVKEALDGGLVREDGRVLYPIRGKIPVMLIDEAIALESAG
jgi:uncharacterized protein YbaR (Trm112 family)